MKTLKCDLCDVTARGETFEDWVMALWPHYAEAHADVMNDSNRGKKEMAQWMADNKARFETALDDGKVFAYDRLEIPEQGILTERLILRHWRQSDFEPFARFHADSRHSRYVGGPMSRPMSWRYFAGVIGHWTLRGFGFCAVEEKDSERLFGGVGLWYPEGWPEPELAYWLIPEAQGKGYATEAGLKVIELAFEVMGLQTLVSYIDPENKASIRVAERLGGAYEGTSEFLDRGAHLVYRYSHTS